VSFDLSVPVSECPHCGGRIDSSAYEDGGHVPEVGDLTICEHCARILRFGRWLILEAMSDGDERALLAADENVRATCNQIRARNRTTTDVIKGLALG
jgi:hypothetical protein